MMKDQSGALQSPENDSIVIKMERSGRYRVLKQVQEEYQRF